MLRKITFSYFIFFWIVISSVAQALFVTGFSSSIHTFDRSGTRQATFIGKNFDWSGVGYSSTGDWVTLIENPNGPNRFGLSAWHKKPSIGEAVTFWWHDHNGGASASNLGSQTLSVKAVYDIFNSGDFEDNFSSGRTDLALIEFTANPSSSIKAYPIYNGADQTLNFQGEGAISTSPKDGAVSNIFFMVGSGSGASLRVGTSTSQGEVHDIPIGSLSGGGHSIRFDLDPSGDGFAPDSPTIDQALGQGGDSGAPAFFAPPSNSAGADGYYGMTIIGVNSAVDSNGTVISLANEYSTDIEAQMITAIPEPGQVGMIFGLLGMLAVGCYRWTRL